MGDRTYVRFTVPFSILADQAKVDAVCHAFDLTTTAFHRIILTTPASDEAADREGTTVRLVDGRPCIVHEDMSANWGGSDIEQELCAACIPFIQANAAGHEYGPASMVFDGTTSETIRLDHNLAPIVGIGVIDGRVTVDAQEVADFGRWHALRCAALLWPAHSSK